MASSATAPWKQLLLNSLQSNSHLKHSSYFQLATVGSSGRPSNRTVVFRGFQEDGDKIQINTDVRTGKIEDLKHCPFAEICWYFTDSWEQLRINGRVDIIDGSNPDLMKLEQREKAWFASSLKSRLQYVGPTPGLPSLNEQPSLEPSLDPSTGPFGAFCLLVLDPDQVTPHAKHLAEMSISTNAQKKLGHPRTSIEIVEYSFEQETLPGK